MPNDAPRAIVIRAAGTNCDAEMCRAFRLAGARADLVHVDRLRDDPGMLDRYDLLGFPGGFSFGDDIASGRILAAKLRASLWPVLRDAARRGCPMIGVCNGFQVLVQVGLLPGPDVDSRDPAVVWRADVPPPRRASLRENVAGRFCDRWVPVRVEPASPCVWTAGLSDAEMPIEALTLPVAHGEGRFIADTSSTLRSLEARGQIALRYTDNYNGSDAAAAGVCDPTGRIFGLMPHPDRYLEWTRHPARGRLAPEVLAGETPGLRMFRNAVAAVTRTSV